MYPPQLAEGTHGAALVLGGLGGRNLNPSPWIFAGASAAGPGAWTTPVLGAQGKQRGRPRTDAFLPSSHLLDGRLRPQSTAPAAKRLPPLPAARRGAAPWARGTGWQAPWRPARPPPTLGRGPPPPSACSPRLRTRHPHSQPVHSPPLHKPGPKTSHNSSQKRKS